MKTQFRSLLPFGITNAIAIALISIVLSLTIPASLARSAPLPEIDRAPRVVADTITHTYENPSHGCRATEKNIVHASGYPNSGEVWPNGLVLSGTMLHLVGTAEHQIRSTDCSLTLTQLPVSWTVKYQDPQGSLSDATLDLLDANTLTPTLASPKEGTYFVELVYNGATIITDTFEFMVIAIDNSIRSYWLNTGPDGTGEKWTGRVNAIAFDQFRPGVIYAGSGNGGVWKSTDYGASWANMTNNKGWPTLVVGALAVAPDGSAVYAGTGDPNFFWGGDGDEPRMGVGIFKSTDGGVTWTSANGSSGGGCTTIGGTITRILIDPFSPSTVYAAGNWGMYRSTNGGGCWKDIKGTLVSPGTIYDIAFKPGDSNTVYAAAQNIGLLQTTNVSVLTPTWTTKFPVSPLFIRGGIGVSPAQPQTVYFDYVYDYGPGKRIQIVRSTNQGLNWESLPMVSELGNCTNSFQCDYNFAFVVDPNDANTIFHGDVAVFRFDYPTSGSPSVSNWRNWSGPASRTPGNGSDIHGDAHALLFDPNIPTNLYVGDDGGVAYYDLVMPNRASWKMLNAGLPIGMFRSLAVRPTSPGTRWDIMGGLQDNATQIRASGSEWGRIYYSAGDGWWASYDAGAPSYFGIYYNQNKGSSGLIYNLTGTTIGTAGGAFWNGGMFMSDPFRIGVMLADSAQTSAAANTRTGQLFYAENIDINNNANWTCIDPTPNILGDKVTALTTARVFPLNNSRQYFVGLDSGRIYLVTVPQSPSIYPGCGVGVSAGSAQPLFTASWPTGTQITGLAEDPSNPCELYVTAPNSVYPAERVFRIDGTLILSGCYMDTIAGPINMAASLPSDLDGNPPDYIHPHAIAVDPLSPTLTYIGTDRGMYMGRENTGLTTWTWARVSTVPTVTVTDIKAHIAYYGSSGALYAATYGRGVYQRIFTGGSLATLKPVTITNDINRCQVRTVDTPDTYWNTADVEVDYSYNGAHGDNVHIRPVVTIDGDGAVNDYFIRETRGVTIGQHTANLQVIYGSHDAPPGVNTNGIRVEIFDGGGTFLFKECEFIKTWRRDDARVVEVHAEDLVEEGAPAETITPITVTLSNGVTQTHQTSFMLVVTQGLTVTLQAPTYQTHGGELRLLHYWSLYGHDDNSSQPTFKFVLSDDTTAIVRYIALDRRVYLPIVLKS